MQCSIPWSDKLCTNNQFICFSSCCLRSFISQFSRHSNTTVQQVTRPSQPMLTNPVRFALLTLTLCRQSLGKIVGYLNYDTIDQGNLAMVVADDIVDCQTLIQASFLSANAFTTIFFDGQTHCYFKYVVFETNYSKPMEGVDLHVSLLYTMIV